MAEPELHTQIRCSLLHREGMKQADIASTLGLSQSAVSRHLTAARSAGVLTSRVDRPPQISEQDYHRLEQSVLPEDDRVKLLARLEDWSGEGRPAVARLHVVYTGTPSKQKTRAENQKQEVANFGANAAPYVVRLIGSARNCAVSWGRTIKSLIDSMELDAAGDPKFQLGPDIDFLPICGEPLNHTNNEISPSIAAERLGQIFGSSHEHRPRSLRGVPARIPKKLSDEDSKALERFVGLCDDYKHIFGGEEPQAQRVDMILTSVGDVTGSQGDSLVADTQESEGVTEGTMRKAAGNLGGVWLAAARQSDEIDEINERWLGFTSAHFEACARRAAFTQSTPAPPGVVVVAAQEDKAGIVQRAVSEGLVNTLVISRQLADALLRV